MEAAMSGEDSEPKSKRARVCDGVDLISQLPDDILVSILSSLPLKEAVATSLISPRWSQLWRHTRNLIFRHDSNSDLPIKIPVTGEEDDDLLSHSLAATEWVNSVIRSHTAASIKQFTLSFYLHDFHVLTEWLRFALSRRVETLELDFHVSLDALGANILSSIEISSFRSLKELKLAHLLASGEAIALFVRHCPLLERLVLDHIGLSSDLVICGTLKEFEMISECTASTRFCAPNLTRLRFDSDSSYLILESVPNLVEGTFCLRGVVAESMDRIANAAPKLEILTITLILPTAFPVLRQMARLKKLELNYSLVNTEFLLPVTRLLQASPCLREFTLKISDVRKKNYDGKYPSVEAIFDIPECGMFRHHHLDIFRFSGFYGDAADHIELLKCIVDNCVALREIIITPPRIATLYSNGMHIPIWLYCRRYPNVATKEERKAVLKLRKRTERLLASKVPDNIKLRVV